jgi:hypothetical protein
MTRAPLCLVSWLAMTGLVAACKDPSGTHGPDAPPAESAPKPGACTAGGGQVTDPRSASVFPRQAAGYCLDPNGETRVFGEGGKLPLDAVCTEAFDGECEVYKGFGLKRIVQLRYIDGAGSPGSVEIYLSQFATEEGAYALYTKRVVGDADPVESSSRVLEAGGAGALGIGRAYVWKGPYLAEIQYGNEQETPAQVKASADRVLVALAKDIGGKLPAPPTLPPAAAQLPKEKIVPFGIAYAKMDVLGVDAAGSGAVGFYREGARRYRIASMVRGDEDEAKDLLRLFGRRRGSSEEKNIGDAAYRITLPDPDGAKLDFTVARVGRSVFAIGDDAFAVNPSMTGAERDKVCLSQAEKVARLKGALAAAPK